MFHVNRPFFFNRFASHDGEHGTVAHLCFRLSSKIYDNERLSSTISEGIQISGDFAIHSSPPRSIFFASCHID